MFSFYNLGAKGGKTHEQKLKKIHEYQLERGVEEKQLLESDTILSIS